MCPYATVYTTTHVYPPSFEKNKKMQELTPHELVNCSIYVHWRERERENEDIDLLVEGDPDATVALAQCDLLKFFQCPFC
jgi:hypothetical protein